MYYISYILYFKRNSSQLTDPSDFQQSVAVIHAVPAEEPKK